ncbi:MAG: hypothetical protein IKD93_07175 [Firmicutes bacterium]|nr:hypothetical protein [Bacillota bacterium]
MLCQGEGSGAAANVAAVTGANRLMELFKLGLGFRSSVAQVARSWAVTEEEGAAAKVPRCGFSVAQLLSNGFFTVLTFDAPAPQLLTAGDAIALSGRGLGQYRDERGALRLHEYIGRLEAGQTLLLPSDDLIRAGFSSEADKGYVAGGEALAQYFSRQLDRETRPAPRQMLEELADKLSHRSRGGPSRDLTALGLVCRPARLLTLATGPPRDISRDAEFTNRFMNSSGIKAVCGSTTAELIARELDQPLTCLNPDNYVDPPEYAIPGIDLITEGAVALNRVLNILDDDLSGIKEPNVVERLALTLLDSDKIALIQGRAVNTAHEASLFKQMGIRTRQDVVEQICARLEERGKIIERIYF